MAGESMAYPERLAVEPLRRPPHTSVRVPGSKSITNRALVLAALASHNGECQLTGALRSEDTEVMVAALRELEFCVRPDWDAGIIDVSPPGSTSIVPAYKADLFVANSGTSMRFLTALVALGQGRYRLDGVTRMRERPLNDLLTALRYLGVDVASERNDGRPPVVVRANGLKGGSVAIRGDVSSQFLSGLLMAAPYAAASVSIDVEGALVSQPYVDMTVAMMRQFGVNLRERKGGYAVSAPQRYLARSYDIEADASSASYFWAAASISGGEVEVRGLSADGLQGDARFVRVLRKMGCCVTYCASEVKVRGGPLLGIDVDMNDISDTVMTLAAVACFAEGPTTIRNVAHIRHKETDRLAALATELRRVGAGVEEFADGLTIAPRPLHGAEIETYNDHRMAMSMSLIGLRVPGIVIKNPSCVAKTYPGFFTDLDQLRSSTGGNKP
jgi:3-phosphoshikimate 1-carboxyvinyltransferase